MTDKEKIRAEIERLQDGLMDAQGRFRTNAAESAYHILCHLENFINSMQVEPTSVWHDTKEKPKGGSNIAFWDGYRMMGMDYADCRHLNNWLSHSEKWAYVEDLLKL